MSHIVTPIDCHQQRFSSKRKLEDYVASDEDFPSDIVRMKRDEQQPLQESLPPLNSCAATGKQQLSTPHTTTKPYDVEDDDIVARVLESRSVSCSSSSLASSSKTLHFFVKTIHGNTIVIHANSDDSIESIQEQIHRITRIPIKEQRFIYRGKQLQCEETLADCSIGRDAELQMVCRMRSDPYPKTWQVVNDLLSSICTLCRGEEEHFHCDKVVKSRVKEFLRMTPKDDGDISTGLGHVQIFLSASAPAALVMLFLSPTDGNRDCAEESIRQFLYPNMLLLPKVVQSLCAPVVLEFCKLLSSTHQDDPLYALCRNSLGTMLENIGNVHSSKYFEHAKPSCIIQEIFPFIRELDHRLSENLGSDMFSCTTTTLGEVRNFAAFLHPLRLAIIDQVGGDKHVPMDLHDGRRYMLEIGTLLEIFLNLLVKMEECLNKVEEILVAKGVEEIAEHQLGWSQYFIILKQLNSISMLYKGAEENFWSVMRLRQVALNHLVRYAKRCEDHTWILKKKDVTSFESRRHLVMLMLPEVKDDYEELHEMLIDRAHLLTESFEYIGRADGESLHGGLFMEFKNEEATGPGVLREWFCLVCQALFNPQNPLFLSCPNDHRRFFPNPDPK